MQTIMSLKEEEEDPERMQFQLIQPIISPQESQEQKFLHFFEKEIRAPQTNAASFEFGELAKDSIREMHKIYQGKIFGNYDRPEEHPLFKMFDSNHTPFEDMKEEAPNNYNGTEPARQPIKNIPTDEIFYKYLVEVGRKVNKDYFLFVFKFVVLFRECLNKYRADSIEPSKRTHDRVEYTQLYNAENAPDLCNEFITEFMEAEDYFGLDTNELIEIIQHLCYWLYQNWFTTSRLTLLNN